MDEALKLVRLPSWVIVDVLAARARHEAEERRTRLFDTATAMHPGDRARNLVQLGKMLEKAAKPPAPKLSAQAQADADARAALAHLMG